MEIVYNGKIFRNGSNVRATINGGDMFNASLTYQSRDNMWYLLHNNINHHGSTPSIMHGYTYGWAFQERSRDNLSDGVKLLFFSEDSKEFFNIEAKFEKFLNEKIDASLLHKKDVVKNASQISSLISDDDKYGFVRFINDNKNTTEMKFGRFLKCYINDVKKNHNIDLAISDKQIEQFHNDYISFQKNNATSVHIFKGDEILQGYNRDNYYEETGRLNGSCMTNKFEYLDLYTKNDNIQLLVVKEHNKIIGRSLLWKAENGIYIDAIYTTQDWVYSIFNHIKSERGYLTATEEEEVNIDVDTAGIDKFPYLDTFMYLTPEGKKLYNNTRRNKHYNGTKVLRDTSGNFGLIENGLVENNETF